MQYENQLGERSVAYHATPEEAIDAACRLLDAGREVYGIGTGPLTDTIDKEEIATIYALWKRLGPADGRADRFAAQIMPLSYFPKPVVPMRLFHLPRPLY